MISVPFHYAYLILCVPFVIVWLVIFLVRKDLRRAQLTMSCAAAIFGPLSEVVYFRDYWTPGSILVFHLGHFSFMLEDFIFGFAIGGIASVIYLAVFRERLSKISIHSKRAISAVSILFILFIAAEFFLHIGLNSIYATSLAFLVAAIPIVYLRHDLFLHAIGSGFCVMFVMFLCYYLVFNVVANTNNLLQQGWLIYGTPLDVRLWGIPLTELVWGFTWGFFVGPWYEFAKRMKDIAVR